MICRDRNGRYAKAARTAAPAARQTTDRFHLVQNLRETIERELALHRAYLRVRVTPDGLPAEPRSTPVLEPPVCPPVARERQLLPARRLAIQTEIGRQLRQTRPAPLRHVQSPAGDGAADRGDRAATGLQSATIGQVGDAEPVARAAEEASVTGIGGDLPRISAPALGRRLPQRPALARRAAGVRLPGHVQGRRQDRVSLATRQCRLRTHGERRDDSRAATARAHRPDPAPDLAHTSRRRCSRSRDPTSRRATRRSSMR